MSLPCAPIPPALPGAGGGTINPPQPPAFVGPPVDVGNIVIVETPGALPPPRANNPLNRPRSIVDVNLGNTWYQLWLALLARSTYLPAGSTFIRIAQIVNNDFTCTFVPNNPMSSTPGYGVITMPQAKIVVVSGTTNESQWLSQLMGSGGAEWSKLEPLGITGGIWTQTIWKTAAQTIAAALGLSPTAPPILFVGHSMGGAVASLLAGLLSARENGSLTTRQLTFASPKAGDQRLATVTRTGGQVYRRLYCNGDIVPQLPPQAGLLNLVVPQALQPLVTDWGRFVHAGPASLVQLEGELSVEDPGGLPVAIAGALVAAAQGRPFSLVTEHSMVTYTDRLWRRIEDHPGLAPANWSNAPDLLTVSAALTQAGF